MWLISNPDTAPRVQCIYAAGFCHLAREAAKEETAKPTSLQESQPCLASVACQVLGTYILEPIPIHILALALGVALRTKQVTDRFR